jgi:hypothetical protein
LRVQPKRFELPAPFCGRIAKSLDTDAAGLATFERCPYQIGRKECERYRHIDLTRAALFALSDLFDIDHRPRKDFIKPASTSCNGADKADSTFDPRRANLAVRNAGR